MEQECVEISIVRTEGISLQTHSVGCYVQIDGRLHDVITPLNADNQENEVIVPAFGLLRLIVKNMGCASEVLGSVSFDLKILPKEGIQWLPLFSSMAKDQLFELPEEADTSKILILINPNKKESLEFNETLLSKSSKAVAIPEIQGNLAKEKRKHELETLRMEKKYKGLIETMKIENERHKRNAKKYFLLFEDMAKELKGTKKLLVEERKIMGDAQERMSKVSQEYEENLKRAICREDSLLKKLGEKDKEINELAGLISQLKSSIRSLENEKQQIVDVVDDYKTELVLSNITRLNQELTLVKGLLEESESQRHKLQQFLHEAPETPSKLSSLMSPISLADSVSHENSAEVFESKQISRIEEEFTNTYQDISLKALADSMAERDQTIIIKDTSLSTKNINALARFQDNLKELGSKTHRKGGTEGIKHEIDENEEDIIVAGCKSPNDNSFIKYKNAGRKLVLQSMTAPSQERYGNKRVLRKAPFK